MDGRQIELVRTTWAKLVPIADQAAGMFYDRLFEIDPSVRSLFTGDMKNQGKLLVGMIDTAVKALDDLESIVPAVQDLGDASRRIRRREPPLQHRVRRLPLDPGPGTGQRLHRRGQRRLGRDLSDPVRGHPTSGGRRRGGGLTTPEVTNPAVPDHRPIDRT